MMSKITNSILSSDNDSRVNFYDKVEKHIQSLNYKFQERQGLKKKWKRKFFDVYQINILKNLMRDSNHGVECLLVFEKLVYNLFFAILKQINLF